MIKTLAILALLFPSCAAQTAKAAVSLPLTVQGNRYFAVVTINGEKCKLMIDTGADATIVKPAALGQISYKDSITIKGIDGGTIHARRTDIAIAWSPERNGGYTIIAGAIPFKDFDGILGMDILSRFDSFSIDNQTHTLTLR